MTDNITVIINSEVTKVKNSTLKNTSFSAMFLALAMVMPFLTGQIQQIGSMLLPMHLPIILCSLVCGKKYGFLVGLIAPVMRSTIFHMPPMYPTAIAMSVKLAVLGFLLAFLFERAGKQSIKTLYASLTVSILVSRLFWSVAMCFLLGTGENGFTLSMFFSMAFAKAFPGILLQLILVPAFFYMKNKINKPLQ